MQRRPCSVDGDHVGDHIIYCPNWGTLLRVKRELTLTHLCWDSSYQLGHRSPYSLRVAAIMQ